MLYHLVIILLRKSSKATHNHITSTSLLSVQSGRVWANFDFSSTDSLLEMFARGKPTSKKIISLFDANPETRAQEEALSYLKHFLRGMEHEKLTKFLRFCTGSNMVCVEKITINFNNFEGAERRPVAHTCGAVLDLPATYPSFPLFREEWNSILSSEYWDIDFD